MRYDMCRSLPPSPLAHHVVLHEQAGGAVGLLLDGFEVEVGVRGDLQAALDELPAGGDAAVDGDRLRAADRELQRLELRREDAVAILVGEQRLVPAGQKTRRELRVRGR